MGAQPTNEAIVAARAGQKKWGIPASVTLAQWAQESAWGSRMPAGSNNPFGMKALPGQPFVNAPTWEVYKGKRVQIIAAFRKFDSLTDAFDAHDKLLATGSPYAHARSVLPDPIAFAHALTGVYATDPHYGDALEAIIRGSKLTRYDA
jgi:flagellum-specific peptidoglycan hydrolase FlgJ